MKQATKRIKALVLAMVMMIAMVMPNVSAMAATSIQTTTLKIDGIEAGSTVYAYAIVLADTDANGNTYWKYNSAGNVESYLSDGSLSDSELISIYTSLNTSTASDAHDGQGSSVVDKTVLTLTAGTGADEGYYVAEDVLPGLYVITATSPTYTYNASVVAVNYTYGSTGVAEVADVTYYTVKSSVNPSIDKTVGDSATYSDNNIGDTVEFTISVFVPNYDVSWETDNLRFLITDSLSAGLLLNTDSIAINGTSWTNYTKQCSTTSLVTSTGGFTLNLYGDDVYQYKNSTVKITYTATITDDAGVNFDYEENKATLYYSTAANSTDLSTGTTDTTYHYTFGIDTTVNGTGSSTTTEITKYGVTTTNTGTSSVALAGAKFQLINSNGDVMYFTSAGVYTTDKTNGYNYVTTGSNGELVISGIDAGTYTLKELEAPEGYSLDTTEYTVKIEATYTTEGKLSYYTVTISDTSGNDLTFTNTINTSSNTVTTTSSDSSQSTFAITNTALTTLPSTGSVGVVVVTAVAVLMMAGFGTAFIMLKKKAR